ncbi:unnamed protein product, partial [Discosporangium mesarthrocarpum]
PEWYAEVGRLTECYRKALRLVNEAMVEAVGLRFARVLDSVMYVGVLLEGHIRRKKTPPRDSMIKEVLRTDVVLAHLLLHLKEPREYPIVVERKVREVAMRLHALRALFRGLLLVMHRRLVKEELRNGTRKRRRGDDKMGVDEGNGVQRSDLPAEKLLLRQPHCASCLSDVDEAGTNIMWMCPMCLLFFHEQSFCFEVSRIGNGKPYNLCRICVSSLSLMQAVHIGDMAEVHNILLNKMLASPFLQNPQPPERLEGPLDDELPPPPRLSTALHLAARRADYEVLSMTVSHARRGGMLPKLCLARAENGRTAVDEAACASSPECGHLLATTFWRVGSSPVEIKWSPGARSGADISGGREAVPIPWVNDVDEEHFPR